MIGAVFFAPFLFFYVLFFLGLLLFWLFLIWVGVISGVFQALGLPPHLAFIALLASLLGSYLNIPITKVENTEPTPSVLVTHYGMRYRVPVRYGTRYTTVAVNVGGAVVPVLISLYVLVHWPGLLGRALVGTAIVALIVHRFARPVRGLGIATPMFVPPIVAALCGWILGAHHPDAVAYVSGVIGTLVGADLANLNKLGNLGAPVASVGGAGTFDGIFLTGIVAVLLA
jgi:uncharacterized membrane protein